MKYFMLAVLFVALSVSAFAQLRMFIHKKGGTKLTEYVADVDSVTFESEMIPVTGNGTISSFSIGRYEVTYDLWTLVKTWGVTHSYSDLPDGMNGSAGSGENQPVTMVNWYDIVKWCNARSEKEGLTSVYYTNAGLGTVYRTGTLDPSVKTGANGYCLPTEEQWQFAASGGNSTHGYTYSGSNNSGDVAWHVYTSGDSTHTVGTKTPNELGIYDMSGNVWEWCWDWYEPGTYGNIYKPLRGGSWANQPGAGAVSFRSGGDPVGRDLSRGFRILQK